MTAQKIRNGLFGLACMGFLASPMYAQTLSVETVSVPVVQTEVAVSWSWEGDGTVVSFFSTIAYDQTLLTPRTTEVAPGLFVVDGCIGLGTVASQIGCTLNSPGVIGLAAQNTGLPPAPLPNYIPGGAITFDINPEADEGDFSDLVVTITATTPGSIGDINTVNGRVTLVGSDAVLTLAPAEGVDFGSQDILAPAQTANFTIGNAGETDSLTVESVLLGMGMIPRGDGGSPFSVTDNCDGVEIAPGSTCVFTVTFDPTEVGVFSDIVTVESTAGVRTATVDGEATATANVIINPPFGPVNLGVGLQGATLTASGSVVNTGSGDATVQCNLVDGDRGPMAVFSTTLPLGQAITLAAGAPAIPFSVSCALPADAADGDVFEAEIQCSLDGAPVSDATTHFLSCAVSEFEPFPIPTLQNWALILFAMLMLLVGGISIRMFRV
jgi:hypothetical protein